MKRENFYVLLGLAFDPPVEDETAIKSAIHKKRQEWTQLQDDPKRGAVAMRRIDLLPEIEEVMLDPDRRAQEAKGAQELRKKRLLQFEAELRVLEGKGYLTPREGALLVAKHVIYGIGKKDLQGLVRVPLSETPPQGTPAGEEGQVLSRELLEEIQRHLAQLGYEDLYAFLELSADAGAEELLESAKGKRTAARGKSAKAVTSKALANLCLELFADPEGKEVYNRSLPLLRYPEVAELIEEEFDRRGHLSHPVVLRLVNFAVEHCGCKVLEAEEYIQNYCRCYGMPISHESPKIICPGCGNGVEKDAALCTVCGAPLQGECPDCGTAFSGGQAVCARCGFAVGDMGKALHAMGEAESALIENNWSAAQRGLKYARRYWPGHPRLETLERRVRSLEDRYATYVDGVTECLEENRYYAAMDLLEEAAGRQIKLPKSMENQVRKVLDSFERRLDEVREQRTKPDFDTLFGMLSTVSDSIELNRMLSAYPPEPVKKITAERMGRSVLVGWARSPAQGILEYVLVRKEGGASLTPFDGEIIYEGPRNTFQDTTAKPLLDYHYTIFVRRGGAYSEGTVSVGPIMVVPEVENLRILPTDMGAMLTWDFNPDVREILIWRKRGGEAPLSPEDGIRLDTDRLDGYNDTSLKNDVEYWYYLVAVYMVGGRRIDSKGVRESVIPHALMAPIDQLDIIRLDDREDEYVANWHTAQYTDVLLLAGTEPPDHRSGDMLRVSDLLTRYRKMDLLAKTDESARFRLRFSGGLYLFAAAVTGRFATCGEPRYLTSVPKVEGLAWSAEGDDLQIFVEWPESLEEIQVVWRYDDFPPRPDDLGATSRTITRRQYEEAGAAVISQPEPQVHYFKVYGVLHAPDGGRLYSEGVEMKVDNRPHQELFYQVKYKKPVLSSACTVTLTLESPEAAVVPRMVAVGRIGRLPLRKTDGTPIFELDRETSLEGAVSIEYRTSKLPKNLYIRLFLREEEQYGRFRLLPGSDLKIT